MKQLSNKFIYNKSNTGSQNAVEFTRPLNILKTHIAHLKNLTKEQLCSKLWLEPR